MIPATRIEANARRHYDTCRDDGCDDCQRHHADRERPDAASDWDSHQFGLRDENAADYWREVVR